MQWGKYSLQYSAFYLFRYSVFLLHFRHTEYITDTNQHDERTQNSDDYCIQHAWMNSINKFSVLCNDSRIVISDSVLSETGTKRNRHHSEYFLVRDLV